MTEYNKTCLVCGKNFVSKAGTHVTVAKNVAKLAIIEKDKKLDMKT